MAPLLKSSVLIKSSSAVIWDRIGRFDTWKQWNPFLVLQETKIGEITPVQIKWGSKMIKSRITLTEKSDEKMYWKLMSNDNFLIKEFTECQVTQMTTTETLVTCETKFSGLLGRIDQLVSGKVIQFGLDNMLNELKKKSESH